MSNQWLRLWHDMPNDPKWRTISRLSKQPISCVISVYIHLLVCASNATERGRTQDCSHEDIATALDMEIENVTAIITAMEGRVVENFHLSGWESRQPKREDNSASRAKEWREKQKEERNRTQPNATEPKIRGDKDTEEEKKERKKVVGTRFALQDPPANWIEFCLKNRPDLDPGGTFDIFKDHWGAKVGTDASKLDWFATWRNWVRTQKIKNGAVYGGKFTGSSTKEERAKAAVMRAAERLGFAEGCGGKEKTIS